MSYKRRAAAATALAALAAVAARATAWHFRRRTLQRDFARDGYVIVRGLLTAEEVARVNASCSAEGGVASHAYGRDDGLGRRTRLSLWNHPGNDVLGALARIPRTRGLMEWLLGGEVYHYHSKLMMRKGCVEIIVAVAPPRGAAARRRAVPAAPSSETSKAARGARGAVARDLGGASHPLLSAGKTRGPAARTCGTRTTGIG